ncbi:Asp-tRNA(Asn)/Glu-tRNA(Gln) amidotransferase subunit GatA, partial [Candidatus Dojkabacteria bacterium]|nr:Asp-tRNA(Asn)/Glu-tRNA(Gln) amidotransferase subunit GatA [Candidatus Dojkabacteria bacterium]
MDIPSRDSISETVEKIKQKKISVVDLVKQHIDLAKNIQAETNAFITIFDGENNTEEYNPIEEAKKLDEKLTNGESIDNLDLIGIPFTAKDLYLVKNTHTTFGSKLMEDFVAPYTGTVIGKCLEKGAILIAKCNCDPWGFGGSGENSGFGPTKNPYDLERSPGGSSSGSAASLSAGVGFFSLGTDTGGSVRQPAAMCGLYGYKPTYGRNSRYGIGVMGSSFDTPAFFTRYATDTILIEKVIQGRDSNDATTDDYNLHKFEANKKPVIGIPKEFFEEGINDEVKNAIDSKIEEYKNNGFEVKEVSIPSASYSLSVY